MSIKGALDFDRHHIMLTNASHLALGFGLALVLQHYMVGNAFLPVAIGWVLIVFGLIAHLVAWTRK
jgi:hypothetical protein